MGGKRGEIFSLADQLRFEPARLAISRHFALWFGVFSGN
jgi:hypothetical protein